MTTTINDVFQLMHSIDSIRKMSDEKINQAIKVLQEQLEYYYYSGEDEELREAIYNLYSDYQYVLDERFREESYDEFNAFYKEHIEGKSMEEIDPDDWGYYSDWHKDMYGFRPHHI